MFMYETVDGETTSAGSLTEPPFSFVNLKWTERNEWTVQHMCIDINSDELNLNTVSAMFAVNNVFITESLVDLLFGLKHVRET